MSITPWSFSRLKAFEQCPKQFFHLKIAKDYEDKVSEAMLYGTKAHLIAEEYIRDGKPIPKAFASFLNNIKNSCKEIISFSNFAQALSNLLYELILIIVFNV